ncbi:hypothetical protein HT031_001713 [Scenedesmus sp. PABB004]|nr:hypothetical protein HT031_001713 [Scenedesmus sp. PABB004]
MPSIGGPPRSARGSPDAVAALLARLGLPAGLWQLSLADAPPPGAADSGGGGAVASAAHGFFSLRVSGGQVQVTASDAVQLAAGAHWFLKHWACGSVSWAATGGLQLGDAALSRPALDALEARGRVTVTRAVPWTWYQNPVTFSYSMAFWDWPRWEAELDWMALQGVNLPLMPLGVEALLSRTFAGFGVPPAALADFFPGPAFLAWGRLGNIQAHGGSLPAAYMEKQLALARRVVSRMRELGMTPVYPAFAGFVPRAFSEARPGAAVAPASCWCRFPPGLSCPLLLDPADPLFAELGAAYITTLRAELGWDAASFYIADTFNELKPASAEPAYLGRVAGSVFGGMAAADPAATWVCQAWLFFSDAAFWQPPQIKALLGGVPRGRLVLLDLFADEHPVWSRTEAFYGHPWIFTMLHNFGGNLEMYGALPGIAAGLTAALAAPGCALVGVGMAPEGIEHNPVVFEFMSEMALAGRAAAAAAPGGLAAWFGAYAARRYGGAGPLPPAAAARVAGAWALLGRSVYAAADRARSTVCDIPTSRPGLERREVVGWGLAPHLWYSVADVRAAWELLLQAAAAAPALPACSSAFVYDLVDVSRELMSKIAGRFWADAVAAYRAGSAEGLAAAGGALLGLLADLDELLGTHAAFLLGPALARARAYADDDKPEPAAAPAPAGGGSSSSSGGSLESSATDLAAPGRAGSAGAEDRGEAGGAGAEGRAALAGLYERNLRMQLTIWGTSSAAGDSEVSDYANKEWAGLISGFYAPRWASWLARLAVDLAAGRPYDAEAWRLEALALTAAWVDAGAADGGPPAELALAPRGDAVALSTAAYERYGRLLAPGCSATAATAAAAAAAAATGLAAAGLAAAAAPAAVAAGAAATAAGPTLVEA